MRIATRKKYLFFFLFIICSVPSFSQLRQVYLDNVEPDNEIYKTSFYSPSSGYVAFRDWIGFTTDSGHTFAKKYITLSNVDFNGYGVNLTFGFGISGVKAFSQDTLVAYGDYGLVPAILYSVDGGNTFKLVFHSQYNNFQLSTGVTDMIFPQIGNTGYAVDADRILRTTNKGLTWTVVYTSPNSYFDHLEAIDNNNVFAFSTDYNVSKVLKTINAGTSWTLVNLPAGHLNYAYFLTTQKGWVNTETSSGYEMYYTSNGGSTWTKKNDSEVTPFATEKMKFINDSTGYATAGLFELYKTTDSGKVWERLPRDNNFTYLGYSLNDFQFWGASQLWAGGGHGYLEISTNGGGTPIPSAYFKIDTNGLWSTNTVNLYNYSKPGYQYEWYRNGTLIGNAYNASYIHNPFNQHDSIKLIVSNGTFSDTLIKEQYFYPPVVITSFTPTIGAAGTVVVINGYNFNGITSVKFGGTSAGFTVNSNIKITATVGAGSSGDVSVAGPYGSSSLPGFTFLPPPTITSFTPASAAAGTSVTITGTNFYSVSAVKFGGVDAVSYTVISPTSITAEVGVGNSGLVSVTTPGGTGLLAGFISLPVITSFTPTSGTYGTYLNIVGTGFIGVNAIDVAGVNVLSFTVNSATSITAVVSTGGTGSITVSKPGGSSTLAGFSWFPPPTITTFSPASGPIGTTVTITGTNFHSNPLLNTVYFGKQKAIIIAGTTTSLTVNVPAGARNEPITVTSNNLTAYSLKPFLVTFPNGGTITPNSFGSRQVVPNGANFRPHDVTTADLDNDGKQDLLVVNYHMYVNTTAVSVFHNTTTGTTATFDPQINYNITGPETVSVADIDGDGLLDFAVTNSDNNTLSVFRNTSVPGTISFAAVVNFTTSPGPNGLDIRDFDRDGKPDLFISASTSCVLRNISDPGKIAFAPRININAGGANVVLADFDGDGKEDCIAPHWNTNALTIYRNTSVLGTISFATPVDLSANGPYYIAAGDIDGDGKMDLAAADITGSKATVYRNTGSPGTISFAPAAEFDAASDPQGIALNDFDGDGLIDMVITDVNYYASVFKNTSTPGVVSFTPRVDFGQGSYLGDKNVTTADINGDGKADIVQASESSAVISIYLNTVTPEPFILSFTPTIGIAGTSVTITGNNFNGTTAVSFGGVPAASFTVNSNNSITAIVGNGGAGDVTVTNAYGTISRSSFAYGFPPVITNVSPSTGAIGSSVTITGNQFSSTASDNTVFFGGVKANVTAASPTSLTVTAPTAATYLPVTVTTGNLTGFGSQRFMNTFTGAASTFSPVSFDTRVDITTAGGGRGVTGDFDGDGKLDLVSITGTSNIGISRNTGGGGAISFASPVNVATGADPSTPGMGDLDGDGKLDLVTANYTGNSISVLRNTSVPGTVSFAVHQDILTGPSTTRPGGVSIVDIDKDGKPDIAVASYYVQTVSVFRNISTPGNILFGPRITYKVDGYPTDVELSDIDGDGKPEIVVPVNGPNEISVFKNMSVPGSVSFATKTDYAVQSWPSSVSCGDIDGDGKADVLVANTNSASISVFRNTSAGTISFAPRLDYSVIGSGFDAEIGDLDGDGKPEIVAQNESGNKVSVFKNNSTPGTISLLAKVDYTLPYTPLSGAIADMDHDGKSDMVVFNLGGIISIFRYQGGEAINVATCVNSTTTLTSDVTGTTYQWQQNTGSGFVNITNGTNISGATTATLQLINIPLSWNTYQFRCVVNGSSYSTPYVVAVNNLPFAFAGTDASICAGNSVTLGFYPETGNTYQWTPSTGLSSASTAQPVATPTVTTSYILTVTNTAGCIKKDTVNIQVIPTPATPSITAGGSTTFCNNTTLALTSSAAAGNQWYYNSSAMTGVTAQTIYVYQPGSYTVRATANGCTSNASAPINTIVIPAPPVPTVNVYINVFTSSSATGNQWYRDGLPIAGATSPSYTATTGGTYYVTVTSGSCSSSSAPVIFIPTAINSPELDAQILVKPNPVHDRLTIRYGGSGTVRAQIVDVNGNAVMNSTSFSGTTELNVSRLAAGTYVVSIIHTRTGAYVRKVIVKM